LTQVTEDFDRYCSSTIERAKNAALTEMQIRMREAITMQLQPAVDAGVAGARAQLDGVAREIATQQTQRLELKMREAMENTIENTERALESRTASYDERLESRTAAYDERLESSTAAYDEHLAATANEFCRELARRMSHQNVA
jgi:hypothetical protein